MLPAAFSRRAFLRTTALASVPACLPAFAYNSTPTIREREAMDSLAMDFMVNFKIPGFSVAFARRGAIAYASGYGLADTRRKEAVTVEHSFRIGSLSKLITSAAIYTLVEQDKLSLDDHVLGPNGILSQYDLRQESRERLVALQVRHLLTHTGGGWQNDRNDPAFAFPNYDLDQLIADTVLHHPQQSTPGTHYAYSNFGYLVLGRIIEFRSKMPYERYVREHVLTPSTIHRMALGKNARNRDLKEVAYYGPGDPYRFDFSRLSSCGAWIASPTDLVTLAMHLDGDRRIPDILKPESVRDMLTPTAANPRYAKGWQVSTDGNYWHTGGYPGMSSLIVRTISGTTWAATANSRPDGVSDAMGQLMWHMARCVPSWGV